MTTTQPAALPELNPADIVVDVMCKAMGGFAPVNTSGVRVTHKPSGVSVTVDSERSQHKNKHLAWEKLRAILAALQPQPAAAVSDEEISRLWSWSATAEAERTATTQQHAFAYALLALRPQAEPAQPRTFDDRNAKFREENWQIRFDAAVEARRAAQEQLYTERERRTAEVKRLQAEIGRLQSLRPQAVPMTPEQVRALVVECGYDHASTQERADFINGVRTGERWHRITAQGAQGEPK